MTWPCPNINILELKSHGKLLVDSKLVKEMQTSVGFRLLSFFLHMHMSQIEACMHV